MTRTGKASLSFSLLFGTLAAVFLASHPLAIVPPVPTLPRLAAPPPMPGIVAQAASTSVAGFTLKLQKKVNGKMSTFTLTSTPPTGNYGLFAAHFLFTIPAGTWTGATWEVKGTCFPFMVLSTPAAATHPVTVSPCGTDNVVAATVAQLADINAAAGSTLDVFIAANLGVGTVTSFTLELTGTLVADHCSITPSLQETVVGNTLVYTITIYDSLSNPTPAPVGGQVFTVRDNGGGGTLGT